MENLIVVTNWEKVEKDDFYLTDEWIEEAGEKNIKLARKLQENNELYYAYIVDVKNYALYSQIDSHQILIDLGKNEIISCETEVIDTDHIDKWEYQ